MDFDHLKDLGHDLTQGLAEHILQRLKDDREKQAIVADFILDHLLAMMAPKPPEVKP